MPHLLSRLLSCQARCMPELKRGPQPPTQPAVAHLPRCIFTRNGRHGLGHLLLMPPQSPPAGLGSELLLATLAQDQVMPKLGLHWGSGHLAHLHRTVKACSTLVAAGVCAAGRQTGHEQLPARTWLCLGGAKHPTSKQAGSTPSLAANRTWQGGVYGVNRQGPHSGPARPIFDMRATAAKAHSMSEQTCQAAMQLLGLTSSLKAASAKAPTTSCRPFQPRSPPVASQQQRMSGRQFCCMTSHPADLALAGLILAHV